jgi:thioredoxin
MENKERPVLIQAGASWCQPCVMLKPILTELIKSHEGAVEYLYVDVDKNQQIAQMLQIQSIPVCYMVRDGELVEQMVGVRDEESIKAFIQKGLDAGK